MRTIAIDGLPACLNPDPDSRLTSIVKVVRLSSIPFFPKRLKDKSMESFYFIGVDVSKKKLDFCVMFEGEVVHEEKTANHPSAIMALIHHLEENYGIENPAEIKYSSGVQRGKNDKVDAKRIAIYACRFQDKVQYYERPTEDIERLKQLESERTLYVNDLAKYKGQLNDQKDYMPKDLYERKIKRLQALMEDLEEAIQAITEEMDEVINSCPVLSRQKELLMSIDGVGRVVATNMIIVTEAFTRFEDPRKFNCYAGVAPFSYSSGSSQHSKARVSHRADKVMKRLLHLAAVAVTHRVGGELKMYYERKVAEGKNKMSVINALRAKIVARMFAVIKRNEKYKPILS